MSEQNQQRRPMEHSRGTWFSPYGTEWVADTYEEALEMERDSLVEQLEAVAREREEWRSSYEHGRRIENGLREQLEAAQEAVVALNDGYKEQEDLRAALEEQLAAAKRVEENHLNYLHAAKNRIQELEEMVEEREGYLRQKEDVLEQLEAVTREREEWRSSYEHGRRIENGLREQLEAAHAEIDGLNERIELRADEDSIYRVYDAEVERRQQAERERDDERRRAVNAETRIITLQRGKL